MAFVLADRVKETASAPGTGTVTLLGAATGYQSFSAGIGASNTTYYTIADQTGSNWEVGYGTVGAGGTTLARTTVLASSNSGSLVNFASGTQDVWCDYAAKKAVIQDSLGTATVPQLASSSTTSTTPVLSFNAANTSYASGSTVANNYLQTVLQNKSGTSGASTNYVLSNDLGTDSTYYGEFGMNSSVYSASTPSDFFSINNGIYFSGHDGDITVGSGNGQKTYMAWGTSGQSAHVINASGALGLSTNLGTTPALSGTTGYGTSGQALVSAGSAAAPAWGTLGVAGGGTGSTTLTANNVLLGNGTSALQVVAPGTSGNVLTSNGTTWVSSAASGGGATNGGGTITSSGTNITLTNASTKVQEVAMTAATLAVILPDATTYTSSTIGVPIFLIVNNGTFAFDIKNSSGYVIFGVGVGQSIEISLAGNTTQNQWIGVNSGIPPWFLVNNNAPLNTQQFQYLNANPNSNITIGKSSITNPSTTYTPQILNGGLYPNNGYQTASICTLSSTQVFAAWIGASDYAYGSIGTISGATISWSTPTLLSSYTAQFTNISVVAYSSTSVCVWLGWVNNSVAITSNISGSTITSTGISGGTGFGNSGGAQLFAINATYAIIFFSDGGSGNRGYCIKNNGASAPSFISYTSGPYAGDGISACQLNSNTFLMYWSNNNNSGGIGYFLVCSVNTSTGAVTSGTPVQFLPSATSLFYGTQFGSGKGFSLVAISATEAILCFNSINAVQRITISGTVPTISTCFNNQQYATSTSNSNGVPLLSGTDFIVPVSANGVTTQLARYSYNSTTGITFKGYTIFSTAPYFIGLTYFSANTAVAIGIDTNMYPSASFVYLLN